MSKDKLEKFSQEKCLKLFYEMLRIRRFEEKSAELYSAGKIRGFLHLYNGEEAIAVGVMEMLRDEDSFIGTYREHGHALARGVSMKSIMAEMYGKVEGCSRGRGGSMHLYDKEKKFYGGNAIVGGHLPLAVGLGLADKMQKRDVITACFFGDGAVAEGEFHESLNLAALWKLPVLFVCENNFYAMGTQISREESQVDLCAKASSYNVKSVAVDGMDILSVMEETQNAVDYITKNESPYFLEFQTYRFRAHSMFDAELYRDKKEVEEWKKKGPIVRFKKLLEEQKWLDEAKKKKKKKKKTLR
eukprot:NODE_795_length_1192_cov_44.864789_g754_i0.p1 GENE.NODE_795_length_1192_cov_44.864789_g754_i0~~NODE_795_length_1192_cov_44.864789_g754_i0.p1  ORF type:complete len:301 (+),score=31.12 NODE_795_length_1192_cov_44.864789_g754_i0:287-1189(+)